MKHYWQHRTIAEIDRDHHTEADQLQELNFVETEVRQEMNEAEKGREEVDQEKDQERGQETKEVFSHTQIVGADHATDQEIVTEVNVGGGEILAREATKVITSYSHNINLPSKMQEPEMFRGPTQLRRLQLTTGIMKANTVYVYLIARQM